MFLIRFIRLPLITLSGSTVLPGPASRTYYEVPPILRSQPDLNIPGEFRSELSSAFSLVYHLKPHAIALSYKEQRSLLDYIDYEAYALSSAHYVLTHPRSPAIDQLYTMADVVANRRLAAKNQMPQMQVDV